MKKLVYGALALSAAMAVSFGVNVNSADAANPSIKSIDAKGDTLTIKTRDIDAVFVGVPTFSVAKGATTATAKVASWDFYDATAADDGVLVDISKYAVTKDNYLMVKYDTQTDSEAVLVKIPAAKALSKVTMNKDNTISVKAKENGATVDYKENDLVYYTENGEPAALSIAEGASVYTVSDLAKYQNAGATLYVRAKETTTGSTTTATDLAVPVKKTTAVLTTDGEAASDANKVTSYTVISRQSKAFKVTVKKLANAPKPTVDYVNGTITVKGSAKKPIKYALAGKTATIKNAAGINQTAEFNDGTALEGIAAEKKVFTLGDTISKAYGNFYIDLTQMSGTDAATAVATTKLGRTTFAGQKWTVLTRVSADDPDVTEDILTADVKFISTKKGYSTIVTNIDTTSGYRVTASNGTKSVAGTVKAAGKSAATVTLATGFALTDTVTVKAEKLGNKTTCEFPGIAEALTKVTKTSIGDTEATFDITIDSEAFNESASKVLVFAGSSIPNLDNPQLTSQKGNGSEVVVTYSGTDYADAFAETNGETKAAKAKGVKVKRADTGALIKLTPISVEETDDDGEKVSVVKGFTFKMPAVGVIITKD